MFLVGMTIVDGMTMTGGTDATERTIIRTGSSWFLATLRWAVNFTSDYVEWSRYKDHKGSVIVSVKLLPFLV